MVNYQRLLFLPPDGLDQYLQHGWYRMGQRLFTVDHIYIGQWIRVFWLRFRLADFRFGKKQTQLLKRNAGFNVRILPLKMTFEKEELYDRYFQSIDFEASETASDFLFEAPFTGKQPRNIFNSQVVEVRDGTKLIACGIFDLGADSMAGILNFYDPEYKKYGLGKYMILKKIEYALQTGKTWYYPGYIGHNFPKFDYKLDPGKETAEIYEPFSMSWLPYRDGLVEQLTLAQHPLFFTDPDEADASFSES